MPTCPRCQCQDSIKNGKTHYKKQNYRCKQCNRQFVADNTHTIPEQTKRFIAKALAERNSLRSICRIFSVSINWLIKFARQLWQQQYPLALKGWQQHWQALSCYFAHSPEIRRIMYTTNLTEGVHRQLRKVTKTKGAFSPETGLLKLLYLCIERIGSKWTKSLSN